MALQGRKKKHSDKGWIVQTYGEYLNRRCVLDERASDLIPRTSTRGFGIYVLLKGKKIRYIGLARTSIRKRLRDHLKDHLKNKWNRFSFYKLRRARYSKDTETLLLRLIDPPDNGVRGKFSKGRNVGKRTRPS